MNVVVCMFPTSAFSNLILLLVAVDELLLLFVIFKLTLLLSFVWEFALAMRFPLAVVQRVTNEPELVRPIWVPGWASSSTLPARVSRLPVALASPSWPLPLTNLLKRLPDMRLWPDRLMVAVLRSKLLPVE